MKTYVDLGGTSEFQLYGAILIYRGGRAAFATYHPVDVTRTGSPQLSAAQPLTTAFLKGLAGDLGFRIPVEILPENVLVRSEEVLVWWSPARVRTMFFSEHAKDGAGLSGKRFPHPALVFKVAGRALWVRALAKNRRPGPEAALKTAPYWNCSESGHVCQGSMRAPEIGTSLDAIGTWERAFFQSEFTHAYGAARLTSHPGGFAALWTSLVAAAEPFPARFLTDARENLRQFVERREQR